MKKLRFLPVLLLLVSALAAQPARLPTLSWEREKVAPGLLWKHVHTDQLFNSKQNLNLLQVNGKKRPVSIAFSEKALLPTSQFAREAGASAAVNAGFFNMKEGGSVTYLKVDGRVINENGPDLVQQQNEILEGVFAVGTDGRIAIAAFTAFEKEASDWSSALVTGPLLLLDGQKQELLDRAFNTNRHPRTAACLTQNGRLLLLTADGRHAEAQGLSLHELTDLLLSLGCKDAINLDGGGSTTMWIKDKPGNGVVNCPSDNKQFDHEGERKVANAIVVK